MKPLRWIIADAYHTNIFKILKYVNNKSTINFYGISRSGNHVVIKFLMENNLGTSILLNDLQKDEKPKEAKIKESYLRIGKPLIISSRKNYLSNDFILENLPKFYGTTSSHKNLLLLRDPYNLFASLYKWNTKFGEKFRNNDSYRTYIVSIWKDNAKVFLKWKNGNYSNNIPIKYNDFISDFTYRKEVLIKVGLPDKHMELNYIPDYGHGSSFSNLNRKASSKEYNQRFLKFLNDEKFKSIFDDLELNELSFKIFGNIDNIDKLIK